MIFVIGMIKLGLFFYMTLNLIFLPTVFKDIKEVKSKSVNFRDFIFNMFLIRENRGVSLEVFLAVISLFPSIFFSLIMIGSNTLALSFCIILFDFIFKGKI